MTRAIRFAPTAMPAAAKAARTRSAVGRSWNWCVFSTSRDAGTRRSTSDHVAMTRGVTFARLLKQPKVMWPFASAGSGTDIRRVGRRAVAHIAVRQPQQSLGIHRLQLGRRLPAVGDEPVDLRQAGAVVLHADPLHLHRREPMRAGRHARRRRRSRRGRSARRSRVRAPASPAPRRPARRSRPSPAPRRGTGGRSDRSAARSAPGRPTPNCAGSSVSIPATVSQPTGWVFSVPDSSPIVSLRSGSRSLAKPPSGRCAAGAQRSRAARPAIRRR